MKICAIGRPYITLLAGTLLLAMIVVPGVLLLDLRANNAPEVYFPTDAPAVRLEERIRSVFPPDQLLVVLFKGPQLLGEDNLRAVAAFVARLERRDDVERIIAVTNVDQIRGASDGFEVMRLIDLDQLGEEPPRSRLARLRNDRFAPEALVSHDGSTLAVVVRPANMDDSVARSQLVEGVREEAVAFGLAGALLGVTGNVAVDAAQLHAMIWDTLVFVPLTTGIGLLLIWVMFRSLWAVALAALAITAVVVPTVSVLVLIERPMTLVGTLIAPLMTALTVALLMHLYNAIRLATLSGIATKQCVSHAVGVIEKPARFTAITTAAGLASLTVSPIAAIEDFGFVAATGVIMSYIVVVWCLPSLIPYGLGWRRRTAASRAVDLLVRKLTRLGIRRWPVVIVFFLAGSLISAPFVWRVTAESDLYEFFHEEHPLSVATREAEASLSGVMSLQFEFRGAARDSVKELAYLKYIDTFQAWLEQQPEVDRTFSMVDLLEEMNWAFNQEEIAFRTLPDSQELVSQYLLIYDGQDLVDVANREFNMTLVTSNLHVRGARATRGVIERVADYFAQRPPPPGLRWAIGGFGRLFADQEHLLITGQIHGLWVAFGLVLLIMVYLWRSVTDSLICMIPNASPILAIFVLMGIFEIRLDFATAIIASLAIGIAVDDTIHIFHGYKRRLRAGASSVFALARSYQQSGRAIVLTTIILCAEFLMLTMSAFVPTTQFGWLTAVGLIAALAFDLLLLPAIVIAISRLGR